MSRQQTTLIMLLCLVSSDSLTPPTRRLVTPASRSTSGDQHLRLSWRGNNHDGRRLMAKKYSFELQLEKLIERREGLGIGRDVAQCEIGLSQRTVSRLHARLLLADGALQIDDLDSTNGTSVAGELVLPGECRALQVGANLKIGEITLAVASS